MIWFYKYFLCSFLWPKKYRKRNGIFFFFWIFLDTFLYSIQIPPRRFSLIISVFQIVLFHTSRSKKWFEKVTPFSSIWSNFIFYIIFIIFIAFYYCFIYLFYTRIHYYIFRSITVDAWYLFQSLGLCNVFIFFGFAVGVSFIYNYFYWVLGVTFNDSISVFFFFWASAYYSIAFWTRHSVISK